MSCPDFPVLHAVRDRAHAVSGHDRDVSEILPYVIGEPTAAARL
jgi:hypothetical protein